MENQENIFLISVEWVQQEAEEIIKRRLSYEELSSVKKGIESGLLFGIDIVFRAAITDAVRISNGNCNKSFVIGKT
ncbi:MAG: hypothetical protein WC868_01500 [Bacteroidales bacterium]